MDAKKVFSQVMLERHTSYEEIAAKLGMNTQSLRNKISRGNYGLTDFIEMMDILECDVQVVTRDSRKVFDWSWKKRKKVNTGIDYKNNKWRPGIFIDADKRESIERWFTDKGYKSFNEYVCALIDEDMEKK